MLIIQNLSIWFLAPLLALVLLGAHEFGSVVRRRFRRRKGADASRDDHDVGGVYLPAALGLLSLLIAFAFSAALERYNVRRDLVGQEALAIGSYYQQLLRLPEPGRTRLASGLVRYLDTREAYSTVRDEGQLTRAAEVSEAAGTQLWLGAVAVELEGGGPDIEAALERAGEMFKIAGARRDALAARVPATILHAVLIYAGIAAGFIGYAAKPGWRPLGAPAITFLLLALAISLVLELDGARSGAIRVDQTPLISAAQRLRQFEALRHVAPPEPWLASTP